MKWGSEEFIKLLLAVDIIDLDSRDNLGRTAIVELRGRESNQLGRYLICPISLAHQRLYLPYYNWLKT